MECFHRFDLIQLFTRYEISVFRRIMFNSTTEKPSQEVCVFYQTLLEDAT